MAQEMQSRIALIERFIQARKASKKEPMVMVSICDGLLKESNLEDAIRVGDCLAMLVEFHYSNGNMQDAYNYMKDMKAVISHSIHSLIAPSSMIFARPWVSHLLLLHQSSKEEVDMV